MGRKKKFIDNKKSATFQLISRDSSDPNYSEGPSGDRVFFRVDGNSEQAFFDEHDRELSGEDDTDGIFDDAPEDYSVAKQGRLGRGSSLPDDVRREILELGFPDDGYNYLSHLRDIKNAGGGSLYYQNPKAMLDQLPRDVKAYDASRIEVSKANDDNSYKKSIYGVALNTVPVRIQKAIDPEVAALLDDSDVSRFGSDVEDLEEDFVFNANLPDESEAVEIDNKSKLKEEYNTHSSQDKSIESYGIDEVSFADSETLVGEKPRERRLLDEQFDLLERQEYGTDSEDGYDNATSEEDESHDFLESKLNNITLNHKNNPFETDGNYKLLSNDKNTEEEPISLETAADLRPRCIQYAEQFHNENDKEEVVFEESSDDESEKWDCETIITTYSNLDNHPGKIEVPGGRKKKLLSDKVPARVIALKGKEMIPVDFLPHGHGRGDVKEKSKVKNVEKPKKLIGQESKEEKKERKVLEFIIVPNLLLVSNGYWIERYKFL